MIRIVAAFVLPLAWFASEFQQRIWLRVMLGICAAAAVVHVTTSWVDFRENFAANHYFAEANASFVRSTISGLKAGHCSEVLDLLVQLERQYDPNYETRDDFDKLVAEYSARIQKLPINVADSQPQRGDSE